MKAVLCRRYGGLDELSLGDVPEPVAGAGEAIVTVKAVGLNFFDILLVAGKYQHRPAFPFSPGAEFAGVVETLGANVFGIRAGDRVIGHLDSGAARERVAISAEQLIRIPDALDFE